MRAGHRWVCALLALAVAGCAGSTVLPRGGAALEVPSRSSAAVGHAKQGTGKLALRVTLHKRKRSPDGKRPRYLSPATQAIVLAIAGPTGVNETAGLQPGDSGCTSNVLDVTCTIVVPGLQPCDSSTPCYTATFATYDAVAGCPGACSVPAGANELSSNQNVAFNVAAGITNSVGVTLDGIPTSLVLVPFDGAFNGSTLSGFTTSKCASVVAHVGVYGLDADGDVILGPGAPVPSLSTSDSAHLAIVATPAPATPNTFGLYVPAIPQAKSSLHLTATVTPLAGANASPVNQKIYVTFDSAICGFVTSFSNGMTPKADPYDIATGKDGNLWFTEATIGRIGKITTGGTITEYSQGISNTSYPFGITAGPDGNMWFALFSGGEVGRITPAGSIEAWASGISPLAEPNYIAAGADGNLWFTQIDTANVGRITPAGSITEFPLTGNAGSEHIAPGPDGSLWFAQHDSQEIGHVTPDGTVTYFSVPGAQPSGITQGPDGNVWFTDCAGKIGRITPLGSVTEWPLPAQASQPRSIVVGPDSALWFSEYLMSKIGRITTDGTITEISVPGSPNSLTVGPDGSIWFTEIQGNAIGRLQ